MNLLDNEEQIAQKLRDQKIDDEAKAWLRRVIKYGAIALALIILAACCASCSALIPKEYKEQVAVRTAGQLSTKHTEEMTKRFATAPVEVKLGGIGNKLQLYSPQATPLTPTVTVPQARNAQILNYGPATPGKLSIASSFPEQNEVTIKSTEEIDSNGNDRMIGTTTSSIPLFVKIIGFALGVGALAAIVLWIIRSVRSGAYGAAAQAAFGVADRGMASAIGNIEAQLQTSNDPAQRQTLLATLASLNKERGKIASQAPPPVK